MKETTKATRRRWAEDDRGEFPWRKIFTGRGIDVGAGDDPLTLPGCEPFDTADGDANHLSTYFAPDSFDYLHASQCLEHMLNPIAALLDWMKVVKQGGYLIITVPDFDLYEKRVFPPSRWNADHKSVFSLWRQGFQGVDPAKFFHVPTMLEPLPVKVLKCDLVTTNFNWQAPETVDQTFDANAGVECWIEFVLKV